MRLMLHWGERERWEERKRVRYSTVQVSHRSHDVDMEEPSHLPNTIIAKPCQASQVIRRPNGCS